jgi:preprotein translocase subunit SecF
MKIIKYRNYYLAFSGTLTVIAILLWIMWGLNLGIDFTGGSLLEIEYPQNRPEVSAIKDQLTDLNLNGLQIQSIGTNGYVLRFQDTGEEIHQTEAKAKINVVSTSASTQIIEKRFDSVGPSIGTELKTKAFYAIILVVISIIIYIAVSFRKVSYPVSSWKYGVAAIIALVHDIFVTIGIFVILGKFLHFEVNTPFVAALLTILGYSVNDTIVVFDRIRENLHKYEGEFEEIVEKSIWETMARSINTIVTVELALLALLIFGGGVINDFVLPLLIGIFFGAYSSIFIASQALVAWQKLDWALKKSES